MCDCVWVCIPYNARALSIEHLCLFRFFKMITCTVLYLIVVVCYVCPLHMTYYSSQRNFFPVFLYSHHSITRPYPGDLFAFLCHSLCATFLFLLISLEKKAVIISIISKESIWMCSKYAHVLKCLKSGMQWFCMARAHTHGNMCV